jgi:hypothetical protein
MITYPHVLMKLAFDIRAVTGWPCCRPGMTQEEWDNCDVPRVRRNRIYIYKQQRLGFFKEMKIKARPITL